MYFPKLHHNREEIRANFLYKGSYKWGWSKDFIWSTFTLLTKLYLIYQFDLLLHFCQNSIWFSNLIYFYILPRLYLFDLLLHCWPNCIWSTNLIYFYIFAKTVFHLQIWFTFTFCQDCIWLTFTFLTKLYLIFKFDLILHICQDCIWSTFTFLTNCIWSSNLIYSYIFKNMRAGRIFCTSKVITGGRVHYNWGCIFTFFQNLQWEKIMECIWEVITNSAKFWA